jgi:hypothetical protein
MSNLEGIRLVLAGCGILLSAYAAISAHNGSMVFASPIRPRMVWRRRVQMYGYLVIFLAIGGQTVSAALVPDPPVITAAGMAVSYVMMVVMLDLMLLIVMFSIGWVGTEAVVGRTPLQPDSDQTVVQASLDARDILHDIHTSMGVVVGTLELSLQDTGMSFMTREQIGQSIAVLIETAKMQDAAHALIRSQTADIELLREDRSHERHQ